MMTLAIIAGQGRLPLDIAKAAVDSGHQVCLFSIAGQADADYSAFSHHVIDLGSIAKTRSLMIEFGCDHMVMVGKVERPAWTSLRLDKDALSLLGKSLRRGDDNLLRLLAGYFSEGGIETISPDNFLPDRQLAVGRNGKNGIDPAAIADDIDLGKAVLEKLGALDVGQSVIVQQGRVMAIEAAEGTDAMIRRTASLLDKTAAPAVLVKMPKTEQDLRLDRPVFGIDTIRAAAQSAIGVIALSADGVLLADSVDKIIQTCEQSEITLVGLGPVKDN